MATIQSTGSSTANNADVLSGSKASLNKTYTDFLKLLTTQLQNQDPTQPADTNQITQQIASLSQVEQQLNTNTILNQLVSSFNTSQFNSAVSYIGRQIDAEGNQLDLNDSKASLVYNLPAGTTSATVTITDSAGKTVFTGPGTVDVGRNQVLWNGISSITNQVVKDGSYTFKVDAKDATGKALTATTLTTGTVTAVDTKDGVTSLMLGSVTVPIASVKSVYTAGTNPGA